MLTDASIEGKVDRLLGLKENVIIGKLIPAATGLRKYRGIDIEPSEPLPAAMFGGRRPRPTCSPRSRRSATATAVSTSPRSASATRIELPELPELPETPEVPRTTRVAELPRSSPGRSPRTGPAERRQHAGGELDGRLARARARRAACRAPAAGLELGEDAERLGTAEPGEHDWRTTRPRDGVDAAPARLSRAAVGATSPSSRCHCVNVARRGPEARPHCGPRYDLGLEHARGTRPDQAWTALVMAAGSVRRR